MSCGKANRSYGISAAEADLACMKCRYRIAAARLLAAGSPAAYIMPVEGWT
jgi:hypothetical protein